MGLKEILGEIIKVHDIDLKSYIDDEGNLDLHVLLTELKNKKIITEEIFRRVSLEISE
ncbi:hypothetical protein [Rossellomorea marisflavi]|uniref:hypothetical protein n=1 Tax=Rossellomorea marisflavi TaxID=189381 RepID=UPI003D2F359E